jgi:23S rRNA pseudouridine1911/1915/1917 synthase
MMAQSTMEEPAGRLESFVVAAHEQGQRLDRVLAAHVGDLSRSHLKSLILAGEVAVAGRTILDPGRRVNTGVSITLRVPQPIAAQPQPEDIHLRVAYEDADLLIVDKPAGLVVHPAPGHWTGTLVNALIARLGDSLSGIGGVRRPGIVHRLDKDTSGLLVVAKTDRAHRSLTGQFADHGRTGRLQRLYLAFVWGVPDRPRGRIDAPIARHPHAREKMAVREGGREAVTHWKVVERYGPPGQPVASLLELRLETGRTHQIRVHLAHLGHPLLGDSVYGAGFKTKATLLSPEARAALEALDRQALHAHLIAVEHPESRRFLQFRSELPPELAHLRHALAEQTAVPDGSVSVK